MKRLYIILIVLLISCSENEQTKLIVEDIPDDPVLTILIKKNQIICTIGIGTRDYANKLGIKKVLNFDGDLETLKEKIVPYLKKNMKILIIKHLNLSQNLQVLIYH